MRDERRSALAGLGGGVILGATLLAWPAPASAEQPVGEEFQVNSYTTSAQDHPAIAVDGSGDFMVVWQSADQDGSGFGVFGQRFDASGTALGAEFQVNTTQDDTQWFPDVSGSGDGRFVVVWEGVSYGSRDIFGQLYDASGLPTGTEFQINTYTTDIRLKPAVVMEPGGSFIVVWTGGGQDGDETGVFGRRYDATGTPVAGEFQVNTYTTGFQRYPDVATTGDGQFVVVWESYGQDGDRGGIFGQRFGASGSPIGSEFQVNSCASGWQWKSKLASAATGDFVVVWDGSPECGDEIAAQRFDSQGVPLGGELSISSDGVEPAVASAGDGSFVVSWEGEEESEDATGSAIFGREHAVDGTPAGPAFRVNTYTSGNPRWSGIAAAPEGDFVVTWSSYGQDGDRTGVFGQRYAGPGLHLSVAGNCPGAVLVTVLNAPPDSEVGVVAAANDSGYIKGGTLCPGVELEVGEPFVLPPTWIQTDASGSGSAGVGLEGYFCWFEALSLQSCQTSGAVQVP